MWPFRSRAERTAVREAAPLGEELFHRVRAIIEQEARALAEAGRVTIEIDGWDAENALAGSFTITPSAPDATSLNMAVYDDVVTFGVGGAGAWLEVWSTVDPELDTTLADLIRCVRDGRYREVVKRKGFLTPLKVKMCFGGVPGRRGRDYEVSYGSTLGSSEGTLPMPPTGDFSFAPW